MATLIDGRALAQQIEAEIKMALALLPASPSLATILVGDAADSRRYLRHKHRACERVGISVRAYELAADAGAQQVAALIDDLNADRDVDAVLLQLPLPAGYDGRTLIDQIAPSKDVDGLTTINRGRLALRDSQPVFVPPTPAAVMRLLQAVGVVPAAKSAVVIGRSDLVGLPLALLLSDADATVTLCHSRTPHLNHFTRRADIVVTAAGVPGLVDGSMLSQGCTVIDVAINSVADSAAKRGYRLVGDVDVDSVAPVAAFLTPVPGGVGPVTVAMLLHNVVQAAMQRISRAR